MRSLTTFEMTQPVIPNVVRNPIKNTVIPNAVRNPIISDISKQNEILTLFNMILSISRCLHQPKPNYIKAVLVTIPSTRPCMSSIATMWLVFGACMFYIGFATTWHLLILTRLSIFGDRIVLFSVINTCNYYNKCVKLKKNLSENT